jgi:transcriptional regulator with XRE-family HTH domain
MTSDTLSAQATFGELLRRWRRSRKLSQSAFGQLLNPKARHATVSCWENGSRRPSWNFLRQIVSLTGIPADLALGIPSATQETGRP